MGGHFGAYVPAGPRQLFQNTGFVQRNNQLKGMGDIFGQAQTNIIPNVPNEILFVGAAVLLVLLMMK